MGELRWTRCGDMDVREIGHGQDNERKRKMGREKGRAGVTSCAVTTLGTTSIASPVDPSPSVALLRWRTGRPRCQWPG